MIRKYILKNCVLIYSFNSSLILSLLANKTHLHIYRYNKILINDQDIEMLSNSKVQNHKFYLQLEIRNRNI